MTNPEHWSCTYCFALPASGLVENPPFCPFCGIDSLRAGRLSEDELEVEHLAGFGPDRVLRDALREQGVAVHGMTWLGGKNTVLHTIHPTANIVIECTAGHNASPRWRMRQVEPLVGPECTAQNAAEVAAWAKLLG